MSPAPRLTCTKMVVSLTKTRWGATQVQSLCGQVFAQDMRKRRVNFGIEEYPAKVIVAIPPICEKPGRPPDILL